MPARARARARQLLTAGLTVAERRIGRERVDALRALLDRGGRRVRGTPWIHGDHFEVRLGTWSGVHRMLDDHGRLLGENQGLPYGATTHPTIEERTCPFSGSRKGRPYNASALKQMAKDWQGARDLMAHLRAAYLRDLGSPDRSLTLVEFQVLAHIIISYPAFALRRAEDPWGDRDLPSVVASAFKVMAGVPGPIKQILRDGPQAGLSPHETPDTDALYAYIEDNDFFLSAEGWACAGPERLVREVLQLAVCGGEPATSSVAPAGDELPALIRYGRTVAAIELLLVLATDLDHGTSNPGTVDRVLGAVEREMPAATFERLTDQGPPSRDALVTALTELSAIAAGHLGRPAPRSSLEWAGFAHRL